MSENLSVVVDENGDGLDGFKYTTYSFINKEEYNKNY
jgi:hypothetical protein